MNLDIPTNLVIPTRAALPGDAPLLAALHAPCHTDAAWSDAALAMFLESPGVFGAIAYKGTAPSDDALADDALADDALADDALAVDALADDALAVDALAGDALADDALAVDALAVSTQMAAGFILCRAAGDEAEILTLAVLPEKRRRGLGYRLLADGLAGAAARGARTMFLEVAEDNIAALALYAGAGFIPVGRRPGYYISAGRSIAATVMARSLAG
ncbi:MAG: GNAT family N-acetyltransferase [Rhodospirillaceae bacterium]